MSGGPEPLDGSAPIEEGPRTQPQSAALSRAVWARSNAETCSHACWGMEAVTCGSQTTSCPSRGATSVRNLSLTSANLRGGPDFASWKEPGHTLSPEEGWHGGPATKRTTPRSRDQAVAQTSAWTGRLALPPFALFLPCGRRNARGGSGGGGAAG